MVKRSSETSSSGSWWILILTTLGLVAALLVVWVVRRDTPGRDKRFTKTGSKARVDTESSRAGRGDMKQGPTRTPVRRGWAGRVDRRRLAEALGRRPPGAAGATGGPSRSGADHGSKGAGRGGAFDEEPPTVFPLSAKGIRGAIRARIEEIKECYNGWLAFDDTLAGKLVVAFTIEAEPDGDSDLARIARAEITDSSFEHAGLERCVLVMAESLRFEAPADGSVTVRYPFRFRSSEDD